MKELSIEEKAKAYDEAYKVAENIHRFSSDIAEIKRIEQIFPELAESEDERIRKAIIQHFKTTTDAVIGHSICNIPIEKVLAWIEKQGEHKPNYCHHEVDLSNCSEEYTKGYYDGWNNCNQQHAQLEAEQKPVDVRTTGYWNVQDIEQKPVWSEEDEKNINDISSIIYVSCDAEDASRLITWLKSIRPQNTWKPSEEQMDGLKEAIEFLGCTKTRREQLKKLYEDLKKLKE